MGDSSQTPSETQKQTLFDLPSKKRLKMLLMCRKPLGVTLKEPPKEPFEKKKLPRGPPERPHEKKKHGN